MSHTERHRTAHIGWLRAAVLGVNDGLISTASLVIGVAASGTSRSAVLIAGVAGLTAGSMAMAAGEYVSVSSQADIERSALAREREELAANDDGELAELAAIYVGRGLTPTLAAEVAQQLTARDALAAQGVGFVSFHGAATDPLVRRLDATAGMTRLSDTQGTVLWRVMPHDDGVGVARLRLENAKGETVGAINVTGDHGQTNASIAAAPVGRRLVVAEPARWADHAHVRFAGRELVAVAVGGQPSYALPVTAGQLSITLPPSEQWWRWGQLGLLLVVLFLAAPFGSARSRRSS